MNKLPDNWLEYNNISDVIENKFIVFKTIIDYSNDFTTTDLLKYNNEILNNKLGFIIDLTNTYKFYDPKIFTQNNIFYLKIVNKGFQDLPSISNVKYFIECVDYYISKYPNNIIGIHCTHGCNRSGFYLISYLIERLNYPIEDAINTFIIKRKINNHHMKEDYLNEIKKRYILKANINNT